MRGLTDWLETLTVTQGSRVGEPFTGWPWERRFVDRVFGDGADTAALSIARGNGKSTLVAALAAAAVQGPLAQPRAETVIVASSFHPARIAWEHSVAFLQPWIEEAPKDWKIEDSSNRASVTHKPTGARVRALGTVPADSGSWFAEWLVGEADYTQVHAARPADSPYSVKTWRRANPSLPFMPELERVIRAEAKKARTNDSPLASFRVLRLNLGTVETLRAELLKPRSGRVARSPLTICRGGMGRLCGVLTWAAARPCPQCRRTGH